MLVFGIYLKPWWVWYVEGLSAKRALVIILLFGGGKFHIFFSIIIQGILARLSWWLCLNQYLGWLVQSSYWDKVCGSVQTGNLVLEISAFFFFWPFSLISGQHQWNRVSSSFWWVYLWKMVEICMKEPNLSPLCCGLRAGWRVLEYYARLSFWCSRLSFVIFQFSFGTAIFELIVSFISLIVSHRSLVIMLLRLP